MLNFKNKTMKKLLLLTKMLLAAALLMVGANAWGENMTTMTGRLGLADNSGNFGAYATKLVTIGAGESYEYTFINYNDGASEDQIYHNWYAEIRNTSNSHCGDVRADGHHWVWPDANNDCTLTDNYTGDNYTTISSDVAVWAQAYNGVTVTVTVTRSNDGNTVTVTHSATTNAVSEVASRTYSGTYTCSGFGTNEVSVILANEKSHQKITKVVYTKADGGSIFVAPDHTAGAKWGAKYDGTYESTVDAAAEFYNNDGSGDGWFGCAYAKFTYSELPNSSYTITDATLTYNTNQGGSKKRDDKIYHMNAGFDLDWANFAGQKATDLRNTSNRGSSITVNTGASGIRTNLTGSVTSFIQTIATSQKYILFQWTGNAGAANLYGNGATDYNAPELAITYSTVTLSTATFTETNSLDPTVTIYSDAGMTSEVTNGTLENGTTYYYKAVLYGYNDVTGNFTVSGANPSINITMTAKEQYNYSLKYKLGTADAVEQASGTKYVDETVTIYYPVCRKDASENYYVVSKNNAEPNFGVVISSTNKDVTVNYTLDESIIYYAESENMAGSRYTASSQAATRTSNGASWCSGASENSYLATNWTLDAGSYDIEVGMANRNYAVSPAPQLKSSTDDDSPVDLSAISLSANSYTVKNYTNQAIAADEQLYFYNDNNPYASKWALDYVIVRSLPASESVSVTAAGYATYVSSYALDFTGATKIKAYKVQVTAKGVATMSAVNQVPAGTPVLLVSEGAQEEAIPVIASAAAVTENDLVAGTGAAVATTDGDYTNMILNNVGGNVGFYFANGQTVATNRAYLHFATSLAPDAVGGARMAMRFAGDNITGVANVEAAAEAKAKEGKFIENGKLVIVKNGVKYTAAGAQVK